MGVIMPDIKWIKIVTDIFDNRKIRQIESLPEGDAILVVWLKILCLAGTINDNGKIYFTPEIPYTDQMLSTQFNKSLPIIQLALTTLVKFNMVKIIDDIVHISNWEKYQSVDRLDKIREQTRVRIQKHREEKRLLEECNVTVTQCNATELDIELDIELEKEKEKNKKNIFVPPKIEDVKKYCQENGYNIDADFFVKYYSSANWTDSMGKPVKNWKQKVVTWAKRNTEKELVIVDSSGYKLPPGHTNEGLFPGFSRDAEGNMYRNGKLMER